MSLSESIHISSTERPAADASPGLRFYREMYLIRRVEGAFLDLFSKGLLNGTVHTSIGQESSAVGIVSALDRERDVIFSSHRAHGHYLAYCDDLDGLVGEILGRRTGVCGGVGGTQHLHYRNLYTNGIQGGIVPCAAGAALAEKLAGTGAICVVFLGDGTMGQGTVYESMNVASLWSLPLLFVLEDNGYAQSTPKHLEHAGALAERARPFGIESRLVAADDVFDVHAAARHAVAFVRDTSSPFFLVVETCRLAPHSKGDDTRSREELDRLWERDPLKSLAGRIDPDDRSAIEAEVDERVRIAIESALSEEVTTLEEFQERAWRHRG